MENVKEKVTLVSSLIDGKKMPGDVMVTTIHKLGDQNMKQGCRNLFDAGQALGAAKLAGVGVVVYAAAKTGNWIIKKVKGKTVKDEGTDPELQAAIQCAQKLDREALIEEERKQGVDTSECDEEIIPQME